MPKARVSNKYKDNIKIFIHNRFPLKPTVNNIIYLYYSSAFMLSKIILWLLLNDCDYIIK